MHICIFIHRRMCSGTSPADLDARSLVSLNSNRFRTFSAQCWLMNSPHGNWSLDWKLVFFSSLVWFSVQPPVLKVLFVTQREHCWKPRARNEGWWGRRLMFFFGFLMQRSGNRQLRDNGCKPLLFDQCHHVVIHSMEHLWIIPADEPIPWAFTDSTAIVWGDGPSTRSIRSTCSSRKTVCPCAPRPSRISL